MAASTRFGVRSRIGQGLAQAQAFAQALALLSSDWHQHAPFWLAVSGIQRGRFQTQLRGVGNPDYRQFADVAPPVRLWADSVEQLAKLAVLYRNIFDLGGGNWGGGTVFDSINGNQAVGRIAYNGKVFDVPSDFPLLPGEAGPVGNLREARIVELLGPGEPADPQHFITELMIDLAHYASARGVDVQSAVQAALVRFAQEELQSEEEAEALTS